METISVVIAAKNEESNIRRCLESVSWADEIVVVDDESSDRTAAIAREFTNKVFVHKSPVNFNLNKNYGADRASGDWILSLDADEVIPEALAEEIKTVMRAPRSGIEGYCLNRRNYFLGQWVRGCNWYPDRILRLYRKGKTAWPEKGLHSEPEIQDKTKVGDLQNDFVHYSYTSMEQYFRKFNQYTSLLARDEYEKGTRITGIHFVLNFFMRPFYWFFKKYVLCRGYRDGFRGFFISLSSALTIFTMYAKLWALRQAEQKGLT